MKQVWKFTQKTYRESYFKDRNLNGSCYALAARWCKMMLKAEKDSKFVPKLTAMDRNAYFNKVGTAGNVQMVQETFDTAIRSGKSETDRIEQAVASLKRLRSQTPTIDRTVEIQALTKDADSNESKLLTAHSDVVRAFKLTVREEIDCASGFADYWKMSAAAGCYIFLGTNTAHATAGYVTGGTFWQDYYFFDPNYGEYVAEGEKDLDALMGKFTKAYQNSGNGAGRRLKVTYAP